MQRYLRPILALLIVAALSMAALALLGFPSLEAYTPGDGDNDITTEAALQLTFSRLMNPETVQQRLQLQPPVAGGFSWQDKKLIFTPENGWPPGAVISVTLHAGAQALSFPALPLRQSYHWTFSVSQPRLAFLYPAGGKANVYVYDALSGEAVFLSNVFAGVLDFVIAGSDSGQSALYYSSPMEGGGTEIFRQVIAPRPSDEAPTPAPLEAPPEAQLVLACPLANCRSLTLDGSNLRLAYERTALPGGDGPDFPQVWYVTLDPSSGLPNAEPQRVGDGSHQTLNPRWSAQGRLAYYDTQAKAYFLIDPATKQAVRIPNDTGEPGDWQPNGRSFVAAAITFVDPSGLANPLGLDRLADSHLLLYDAATAATTNLTDGEGIEDAVPAFAPDGERLALARKYLDTRRWTPGRQLWLYDFTTRQARQLTADPVYNHFGFRWSPGGEQLAFMRFNQSTLNEPPELWVIDLNSGEFTQIRIAGYAPQWIP